MNIKVSTKLGDKNIINKRIIPCGALINIIVL